MKIKFASVITPVFNEEKNIENLVKEVNLKFKELNLQYEHIIIDNISNDNTEQIIINLISKNKYPIKFIKNNINNGPDYSSWIGTINATGDFIIPLVADFQDPIKLIPEMIKIYNDNDGIDSILCVYKNNPLQNMRYFIGFIYYLLLKLISTHKTYFGFHGYCGFNAQVLDKIKKSEFRYYYYRGLILNNIKKTYLLSFIREERRHGNSSYNYLKLLRQSIVGINFSNKYFFLLVFFPFFIIFDSINIFFVLILLYILSIYKSE